MAKTTEQIVYLITGFLNDCLSEEEKEQLHNWRTESPEHEAFFQQYTNEYLQDNLQSFAAVDMNAGWKRLESKLPELALQRNNNKPAPVVSLARHWWRYAAVVLLIITGMVVWNRTWRNGPRPVSHAGAGIDKAAGGNRAVLTLADGSEIVLDAAEKGDLARQGDVIIIKASDGKLAYKGAAGAEAIGWNTIRTPRGGQYQVVLPDNSRVWLNAASSIRFPTVFSGNNRTVEVSGEVYVEVAANRQQPFYVQVNGLQVQVLGTSFNVNAYAEEEHTRTTLLEGAVQLVNKSGKLLLTPGKQASVDNSNLQAGAITLTEQDLEQVMAWKNGMFKFDNLSLPEMMRQIARWYDVDISYKGKIPAVRVAGELSRKLSLQKLLEVIEFGEVKMEVSGNRITIIGE